MKVENLLIERKPTYSDTINPLEGIVQIQGEHGKMEVKLSSAIIAHIFKLVKDDVQRVADYNASQSGQAIEEAQGEMKLLEASEEDVF